MPTSPTRCGSTAEGGEGAARGREKGFGAASALARGPSVARGDTSPSAMGRMKQDGTQAHEPPTLVMAETGTWLEPTVTMVVPLTLCTELAAPLTDRVGVIAPPLASVAATDRV